MRVRIHRGAEEVGGNCVEVEAQGKRIVLDIGRPLWAEEGQEIPLPILDGLQEHSDSLLGVLLSHPHQDHYGLIEQVSSEVPLYMGEAAHRILSEAAFFTNAGLPRKPTGLLRHREPFILGPFRVTPFLADHSAFDSYQLLIEADGKKLFYTGDFRGHGRKKGLFDELLRHPPAGIDVLLMEGTHIRPGQEMPQSGPSENDVEAACLETFRGTEGMVLALYSPQNIDRLVSIYKAAIGSGREFVMDLYTASVAAATGTATIPQAGWGKVRVYLPHAQRRKIIKAEAFERTNQLHASRIYPDELARRPKAFVMTFRLSMGRELETAGCLGGATAVWSYWPGYLKAESGHALKTFLEGHGIPMVIHHSSGHATLGDLQRLVEVLSPGRVVPIHSEGGDRFPEYFPRVTRQKDGEWWTA